MNILRYIPEMWEKNIWEFNSLNVNKMIIEGDKKGKESGTGDYSNFKNLLEYWKLF